MPSMFIIGKETFGFRYANGMKAFFIDLEAMSPEEIPVVVRIFADNLSSFDRYPFVFAKCDNAPTEKSKVDDLVVQFKRLKDENRFMLAGVQPLQDESTTIYIFARETMFADGDMLDREYDICIGATRYEEFLEYIGSEFKGLVCLYRFMGSDTVMDLANTNAIIGVIMARDTTQLIIDMYDSGSAKVKHVTKTGIVEKKLELKLEQAEEMARRERAEFGIDLDEEEVKIEVESHNPSITKGYPSDNMPPEMTMMRPYNREDVLKGVFAYHRKEVKSAAHKNAAKAAIFKLYLFGLSPGEISIMMTNIGLKYAKESSIRYQIKSAESGATYSKYRTAQALKNSESVTRLLKIRDNGLLMERLFRITRVVDGREYIHLECWQSFQALYGDLEYH